MYETYRMIMDQIHAYMTNKGFQDIQHVVKQNNISGSQVMTSSQFSMFLQAIGIVQNEIEVQTFILFVGDDTNNKSININDLNREYEAWKQDIDQQNEDMFNPGGRKKLRQF